MANTGILVKNGRLLLNGNPVGGDDTFLNYGDEWAVNYESIQMSNHIVQETFAGTLKKGGIYTVVVGGTFLFRVGTNYLRLWLEGASGGMEMLLDMKADANISGDVDIDDYTFTIVPTEDCTLKLDCRGFNKITIVGSGLWSQTLNQMLPSAKMSIFGDTTWLYYKTQAIHGYHDLSWHKDKLWSFNRKSSDGPSYIANAANEVIATLDLQIDETYKDETTAPLEWKSCDWHQQKDLLLVGNGRANYKATDSYCYIFYDAEDWENMSGAITSSNCGEFKKLDFTELGYKCYGYWAGDANADTMFVSVNKFGDIYLVQLGKGSNNLSQLTGGGGIFSSESDANKYNGSWVVLKHWHQDEYAGDKSDHGGQYYGGYLYLGDNRTDMALVYRIKLNDDGTMRWDKMRFGFRNADGSGEATGYYVDGICAKDGKLYVNILGKYVTAVVDL